MKLTYLQSDSIALYHRPTHTVQVRIEGVVPKTSSHLNALHLPVLIGDQHEGSSSCWYVGELVLRLSPRSDQHHYFVRD